MKKAKVLITIRGGNIEHIAATTDQIEFVIIDHDKALEQIGNLYEPDALMSSDEMKYHIEGIRDEHKPKSDATHIPVPECDVYIKDEGDIASVIMQTSKAKKTAVGSGFGNDYSFMPNDYYRFDVYENQVPVIIEWCEKQNLTYESEL